LIDPDDNRTQNEKDLTMLIQKLIRRIRKSNPTDQLCEEVLDYLVRKNLVRGTDVLRNVTVGKDRKRAVVN
jgi:hypothetical protein